MGKIRKRRNLISNYPSEAIRQVVADMKLVEKTPGYKINTGKWHNVTGSVCEVCMGGAFLLREPGANLDDIRHGEGLDYYSRMRMYSFDYLRNGHLEFFLRRWVVEGEVSELVSRLIRRPEYGRFPLTFRNFKEYHECKNTFYKQVLQFADHLEEEGY